MRSYFYFRLLSIFFCVGVSSAAHADIDRAGLITLTDHGNGTVRAEVMLPCGQASVTAVVRKNGTQVLWQDIVTSQKPFDSGYFCAYSVNVGGFQNNDQAEARFSSHTGDTPPVFTPGPDSQTWVTQTVGQNPIGLRPGHLDIVDFGNASARFDVTLPSNQAYVEVFARINGLQNIAGDITDSETPAGNGYSRYSKTVAGYSAGDFIEFRAYHYLSASAGVFTPGPSETQWLSYLYGSYPHHEYFKARDGWYDLTPNPVRGDIDVYFGHHTSNIVPYSSGWYLMRGMAPMLTVPAKLSTAELLSLYVRKCGTREWVPVSSVTTFLPSYRTEQVFNNVYQYVPIYNNNQLPGQQVDPAFECGGYPMTINTRNGPVTLTTGAKVQFAYVVRHR
jgi:hypothetical protein